MQIELPNQAEDYFNKQAEELLLSLHPARMEQRPKRKAESSDTHAFTEVITDKEIINIGLTGTVDGFGREMSKYFQTQHGPVGLAEEGYSQFEQLIDKLSKRAELREFLSAEFLKGTLFEWFEKRYKGELPSSADFVGYLKKRAALEIKSRKIAIPISFLTIESPFQIGNVTFEYYTKEFFDELENHIRAKAAEDTGRLDGGIRKIRKTYQGVVFSSMFVAAETEKCIEIAKHETQKALMVLRFFSPTTFVPEIPSYFGMMGKVNLPSSHLFIFHKHLPVIRQEIDEDKEFQLRIREQDIQMFMNLGFGQASALITKQNRTKLEDLLMTCLFLFARGITATEFQDKLVFILVSIETLLLKNASEPIQSSVGLRLSFLSASTVDERREITKLVKEAYRYRSNYLHHGYLKSDWELLKDLQHTVWTALRNVLVTWDRFSSQEKLLDFIEEKILSG